MNFKNNIDLCKTAQDMGYRVQLLKSTGNWLTMRYCFFITVSDRYRVHPDDVEAFEADLAAREDAARKQSAPTPTLAAQVQSLQAHNVEIQRANEALRGRAINAEIDCNHARARVRALENDIRVQSEHHKQHTTEDLLLQLRQKLGPRAVITVTMNQEL